MWKISCWFSVVCDFSLSHHLHIVATFITLSKFAICLILHFYLSSLSVLPVCSSRGNRDEPNLPVGRQGKGHFYSQYWCLFQLRSWVAALVAEMRPHGKRFLYAVSWGKAIKGYPYWPFLAGHQLNFRIFHPVVNEKYRYLISSLEKTGIVTFPEKNKMR